MDLMTKRCGCGRILKHRESCPTCADRRRAELHASGVATMRGREHCRHPRERYDRCTDRCGICGETGMMMRHRDKCVAAFVRYMALFARNGVPATCTKIIAGARVTAGCGFEVMFLGELVKTMQTWLRVPGRLVDFASTAHRANRLVGGKVIYEADSGNVVDLVPVPAKPSVTSTSTHKIVAIRESGGGFIADKFGSPTYMLRTEAGIEFPISDGQLGRLAGLGCTGRLVGGEFDYEAVRGKIVAVRPRRDGHEPVSADRA